MDSESPHRYWWISAAAALTAAWIVGAYMPATSNAWVAANLLVAAGRPQLVTLPLAYPAVGADADTLCSLLGLIIVITTVIRWISYVQRYTPPAPPPSADPLSGALPYQPRTATTTTQGETTI